MPSSIERNQPPPGSRETTTPSYRELADGDVVDEFTEYREKLRKMLQPPRRTRRGKRKTQSC